MDLVASHASSRVSSGTLEKPICARQVEQGNLVAWEIHNIILIRLLCDLSLHDVYTGIIHIRSGHAVRRGEQTTALVGEAFQSRFPDKRQPLNACCHTKSQHIMLQAQQARRCFLPVQFTKPHQLPYPHIRESIPT